MSLGRNYCVLVISTFAEGEVREWVWGINDVSSGLQISATWLCQVMQFSFVFHKYLLNAYTVPGILRNSWVESVLTPWWSGRTLLSN